MSHNNDFLTALGAWRNGWRENAERRRAITADLLLAIKTLDQPLPRRSPPPICYRKRFPLPDKPKTLRRPVGSYLLAPYTTDPRLGQSIRSSPASSRILSGLPTSRLCLNIRHKIEKYWSTFRTYGLNRRLKTPSPHLLPEMANMRTRSSISRCHSRNSSLTRRCRRRASLASWARSAPMTSCLKWKVPIPLIIRTNWLTGSSKRTATPGKQDGLAGRARNACCGGHKRNSTGVSSVWSGRSSFGAL